MSTEWVNSKPGKVVGFVGVTGSGKDYQAGLLKDIDDAAGRPVIVGDFSEGIRRVVKELLFPDIGNPIEPDSKVYREWKSKLFQVPIPLDLGNTTFAVMNGRELLQNIGEGVKSMFGLSVWATWTEDRIMTQWSMLDSDSKRAADVIFGSIRFDYEAAAVFRAANRMGKQVEIYFCDYRSKFYKVQDHASEDFAKYFLAMGCHDGQDITDLVCRKIENL